VGSEPAAPKGKPKLTREMREAIEGTERIVASEGEPNRSEVDDSQLFMLFASFSGDVFKTAHASGFSPAEVTDRAHAGDWMVKLRGLIELKQVDKSGEVERSISRAINFVQVNRYRMIIDRIIRKWDKMTPEELTDELSSKTYYADGTLKTSTISAKAFADIATAMEKVHWMSYQAMIDAPQDRAGRKEKVKDEGPGEDDIHAKIAKALAGHPEHNPQVQMDKALAEVAGSSAPKPIPTESVKIQS